jgi:hypothetical protein
MSVRSKSRSAPRERREQQLRGDEPQGSISVTLQPSALGPMNLSRHPLAAPHGGFLLGNTGTLPSGTLPTSGKRSDAKAGEPCDVKFVS